MNIVAFLLVGMLAGWIASTLIEGHGLGALGDVLLGVVGALVGGFFFAIIGVQSYSFLGSLGMSVVGAVLLLFVVGLFARHGSATR